MSVFKGLRYQSAVKPPIKWWLSSFAVGERHFHHMTFCLLASVLQPDCHLHLHLRWADNPYVSGTVHTKDTAPGLIMGAGEWPTQKSLFLFCAYVDCLTLASPHSMINWCNLKVFKQEVAAQCFLFNKGRKNRAVGYNKYE